MMQRWGLDRMIVALGVFPLIAAAALGQTTKDAPGTVTLGGETYNVLLRGEIPPEQLGTLPDDLEIQRLHVTRGEAGGVAGEPIGVEVYRNTLGNRFAVPGGANVLIADDIRTIAAGGCDMNAINFFVFGGGAAFPAYRITQLAIFDGCPGEGGVVVHDLLEGVPIDLPNGGGFVVDLTFPPGEELSIPNSFWFGMAFNSGGVGVPPGWVCGAPAEIGESMDVFHNSAFPCNAWFGGFPANPHGSFDADIFCTSANTQYVGYASTTDSGPLLYGGPGCTGTDLTGCGNGIDLPLACESAADDIIPTCGVCNLSSIIMNVGGLVNQFGNPQPYDLEIELFTDVELAPDVHVPGMPIPGTRGCFSGVGNGMVETALFEFDGSVALPSRFWLAWADNHVDAGPILAGGPSQIGSSDDLLAVFNRATQTWDVGDFGGCEGGANPCASVQVTILCLGDAPTGACCGLDGSCTEGVAFEECFGRWACGEGCTPGTFDPPCGTAACCSRDTQNPDLTVCEDILLNECQDDSGEWTPGVFCGTQDCGIAACIGASGDCLNGHGGVGCSDDDCCNLICEFDTVCCSSNPFEGWDAICAQEAVQLCGPIAPANDFCHNALPLNVGKINFNNSLAELDGGILPGQCDEGLGTAMTRDIWYDFVPDSSGMATISTCEMQDFDTRLAAYLGCECPATPDRVVACNDDGPQPECGLTSEMTFNVVAGMCYKIRVGGFPGSDPFGTGSIDVSLEATQCPVGRGVEDVVFVDPPNGVVDARQPHPVNSLIPRQGISTIVVNAPAGAASACWDICETVVDGAANSITNVMENPAGTYTLTLARTITANAVTRIMYTGNNATGTFISHPGNVNGDGAAAVLDVLAIIDCLNGVNQAMTCPWGFPYSRDIDFNGGFGPSDILREIDLLNGADTFDPANGTVLPAGDCP